MSVPSNLYQVKRIVGHRNRRGKDFYLVHWLGYSKKENTWEPEENFSNCRELINDFMEQRLAMERRMSLRTRSPKDAILSSDEEVSITGATKRKGLRQSPARKKEVRVASTHTKRPANPEVILKYNLRSVEVSSDEDNKDVITLSHGSAAARMTLSESKFRKQLSNIKQGNFSSPQRSTSTPQKDEQSESPSAKVQAKTRLKFESSQKKDSGYDQKFSIVTRQQHQRLEEEKHITKTPTMVAEADDEIELSPVNKETAQRRHKSYSECFPVTWREFALAAFVTGIAAVGYLCYTTEYCTYC